MSTRFYPFVAPTDFGRSLSPGDVPLGFHVAVVGKLATIRLVYSAGSDEPISRANAAHASVGVGVHSSRLFEIQLDLSAAPQATFEAFSAWCNAELEAATKALVGRASRAGPLSAVVALMKISKNWAGFNLHLDAVFPRFGNTIEMFPPEPETAELPAHDPKD